MIQMRSHNNPVNALGFWSAIVAAIASIAFSFAVLLPLLWAPGAPWDDILRQARFRRVDRRGGGYGLRF